MEELAGLYAMLANEGVLRPLRAEPASRARRGRASAERRKPASSRSTCCAAIRVRMTTARFRLRTRWPVAWKTGTSWGFRDAWSAGVVGPYVLVVWIGDFDGQGQSGVHRRRCRRAAVLPHRRRAESGASRTKPCRRRRRRPASAKSPCASGAAICRMRDCPHTVDTWYIPGKSPIRVSQLHRAVAIDAVERPPGVPAVSGRHAVRGVRVLVVRHAEAVPPGGHAAPHAAAAAGLRDGDDPTEAPRIASPLRGVTLRAAPIGAAGSDRARRQRRRRRSAGVLVRRQRAHRRAARRRRRACMATRRRRRAPDSRRRRSRPIGRARRRGADRPIARHDQPVVSLLDLLELAMATSAIEAAAPFLQRWPQRSWQQCSLSIEVELN